MRDFSNQSYLLQSAKMKMYSTIVDQVFGLRRNESLSDIDVYECGIIKRREA